MRSLIKQLAVGMVVAMAILATSIVAEGEVRHESGGVSDEGMAEIRQRVGDYSFELILAARRSGSYLADVDVTIIALPERTLMLEHRTEGPVLLADLPPGRYEVSATVDDVRTGSPATVSRHVVVPARGLRQVVMYFDTGD